MMMYRHNATADLALQQKSKDNGTVILSIAVLLLLKILKSCKNKAKNVKKFEKTIDITVNFRYNKR